ncbi:MAG: chromosomal replication initiator protein DnaA [Candidatus Paceibacterota bacterium]|jgi:chromosomal replication initiator protein
MEKVLDNKKLWDSALNEIELSLSKANFGTWFKNTHIIKDEEGVIYIGVPNAFVRDWLMTKYHKFILKALREIEEGVRSIEYVISRSEDKEGINKGQDQPGNKGNLLINDLGLKDLYTNKESNLNPKYTFETFTVGSFNDVAYAASQAIVKSPGTVHNPLFIYGGTGLGKTHLLQAVGNQLKKNYPDKTVYYITSENFIVELINNIQNNKGNAFKERYRKYDLLIIDDVQFFSNKEHSQEELFHLFNHYYDNNKQIIFSSDKPPKFIPNLEERLRSRFEGGTIIDIAKPDYESRLAILNNKLKVNGLFLALEIVEYVASVVQDSIRELEGALNSIFCQNQAKKREITLQEVKTVIKNNIKPQKTLSIKDVLSVVATYYNIEEKILYEKTRRKEVVKPRQVIMYLLREDFNTSYPYIGQKLGGKDHTTVIHAYEKIKRDIKTDSLLNQEVEQIRALLYVNN